MTNTAKTTNPCTSLSIMAATPAVTARSSPLPCQRKGANDRKDGKVVNEGDDLMAATRYGVMMLRFAETINRKRTWKVHKPLYGGGANSWLGA